MGWMKGLMGFEENQVCVSLCFEPELRCDLLLLLFCLRFRLLLFTHIVLGGLLNPHAHLILFWIFVLSV